MSIKFESGQIVATPGALEALREAGQQPSEFLSRFLAGDWGDLDDEDKTLNDEALVDGSRILASYTLKTGVKLWAITEAVGDDGKRAATTLLLASEY
jgi:hypothetical protein